VLGIGTDNSDDSSPANDLALITYGLNARSYLHNKPPEKEIHNTSFSNFFLQVPGPELTFFHESFVMMHLKLSLYLAHRV